jgi:hypothetical protein
LEKLRTAYGRGIIGAEPTAAADLQHEAQQMIGLLTRLGDREDAPPGGAVPAGTFFAEPHS